MRTSLSAPLGVLSYWIRGNFWIAAVIATSIWLLGAAAIHVSEMVDAGNYNPGNAGVVFYMDIIGPALLIILLVYLRYAGRICQRGATSGATQVTCGVEGTELSRPEA